MERRREDANKRFRGEYVHTIPNPSDTCEFRATNGKELR